MIKNIKLTLKEAISLLSNEEEIHTMTCGLGFMMGCDMSKKSLIEKFKKYKDTLMVAGPTAKNFGHGLAVTDDKETLFIEVDKKKLEILIKTKIKK